MHRIVFFCSTLALALPVFAQLPTKIYAQELIDKAIAKHPEVLALSIHATPPKSANMVTIASNGGQIGNKADQDDLSVVNTSTPTVKIDAEGKRFETGVVLRDVSGDTIGVLRVVLPYQSGDDQTVLVRKAKSIRDELRRKVINVANLMDPFPYVPNFADYPYAQKLVDETMVKHPELLILVMHVASPDGADYPIIASSIGRIGKKADEDDRRVVETGQPTLGAYGPNKTRFGIELAMRDLSGKTIGALSTGFAYRAGDDQQALLKKAEQIEAELRKQIPSLTKLIEPAR